MSYENVNLENGHMAHHQVTRCIHEEELRRDIAAGAKFSQMMTSGGVQEAQDTGFTAQGTGADVRNVSGRRTGRFFGGTQTSSEGERDAGASSAVPVSMDVRQDTLPQTMSVRAENAASTACYGLENPPELHLEMQTDGGVRRVSESAGVRSGSSFLSQSREAFKSRFIRNARKGMRMLKAILLRAVQEKEAPVEKNLPSLDQDKEYLLDSYGKDGAYRQISESGLMKSSMNKKA